MNDEDYIYLRTLPNYKIIEKNYDLFRGKVLKFLLVLTGLKTYKEILEKSDCVIYLLRADTREYAIDEKAISDLKIDKNKLILGLNFCDKIEPINRNININLTEKQQQNLNKKVEVISNIFKVSKSNILTISADTMLNVNKLVNKIVEVVTSAN